MGLLSNWWRAKWMKDPVRAMFQVTGIYQYSRVVQQKSFSGEVKQSVTLIGVVSGEGIEPASMEYECMMSLRKRPSAEAVLPIIVDRQDLTRFRILWNEIESNSTNIVRQSRERAEALRAEMSDKQVNNSGLADSVDLSAFGLPANILNRDPAERLRKLDEMRNAGILSEDEYMAQRVRILDGL